MSNIFVINCLITADRQSNKIYIASSNKDEIVFPLLKIENPKFLYNEIRYNIKNMFVQNAIKFLEEIIISFFDIQNYHVLELLEEQKNKYEIENTNIILLCGVVLHEKILSENLYWIPIENFFISNKNTEETTPKKVVKYVFDQMIL